MANVQDDNPLWAQAEDVNQALRVCQASAAERLSLIHRERLNTLEDYADFTPRDILELSTRLERRRTIADGRVSLPAKVLKNIQVLCFWERERQRKGEPLVNGHEFTHAELAITRDIMRTRDEALNEAPSIKLDRFDPDKWTYWSQQFVTYLSHIKGQQFTALDYVLREEPPPRPMEEMTERDRELNQYPLEGRQYKIDNMTTYRLLSDLVGGTSGYTWIAPHDRAQDGRAAWMALVEHYEDFSRKLIQAYRDLEGTDEEMTEFNKVKTLLEKIQIGLPRAKVAKSHVRQNLRQDIYGAIELLSTEFADMFADAIKFKCGRARGISAVERPAQQQRADDEGPQRSPDGTTTFFGVDVTDVGRTFSVQEMADLGPRGQAYVFRERDRLGLSRNNTGRGGRGGRGRGGNRSTQGDNRRRVGAAKAVAADNVSGISGTTKLTRLPPVPEARGPPLGSPPTISTQGSKGSRNGAGFGAGAYAE